MLLTVGIFYNEREYSWADWLVHLVYCKCGNCEECDNISTEKGLNVHIMNDHEPPEVIKNYEADWIHDQDRFHSQKWDSAMVL